MILVADHLGVPAPFPALVAAAEATERPRLGTFVLNAGFWNPALLAREVATTDALTGGRLELGLGTGYVQAEHEAAGLPWGSPGERVDHLRRVRSRSWTGCSARKSISLGPCSTPRVPLLIGGNGDRMLRLTAEHADIAAFTGARSVPGDPAGSWSRPHGGGTGRARRRVPALRGGALGARRAQPADPDRHRDRRPRGRDPAGLSTHPAV